MLMCSSMVTGLLRWGRMRLRRRWATGSIEAPNSTVLPGLWENHAHPNSDASIYYGDRLGRLWMIYGITTLRDMADQAYRAAEEKESFVSGAAVGPRLFATGEAIDGERTYYPMMIPTHQRGAVAARVRAPAWFGLRLHEVVCPAAVQLGGEGRRVCS